MDTMDNPKVFQNRKVLITGGTGSLGGVVLKAILAGDNGTPKLVRIFSRDEAKQYELKKTVNGYETDIDYHIGDIRCYEKVRAAMQGMDIVINAAALKHVPACENDPIEAVRTNVLGPYNIVRSVRELASDGPHTVLGISTDKACSPSSVMGMTKALQEKIFIQANLQAKTRFIVIRYGNMLESRGSVVPLFRVQIAQGGPVTITHREMTRFLVSLPEASYHLIQALSVLEPGQIYIPQMRSAYIDTLADAMIKMYSSPKEVIAKLYTGVRPGEKLADIIISKEESQYARDSGKGYYVLWSPQPYFRAVKSREPQWEYSSSGGEWTVMSEKEITKKLLEIGG